MIEFIHSCILYMFVLIVTLKNVYFIWICVANICLVSLKVVNLFTSISNAHLRDLHSEFWTNFILIWYQISIYHKTTLFNVISGNLLIELWICEMLHIINMIISIIIIDCNYNILKFRYPFNGARLFDFVMDWNLQHTCWLAFTSNSKTMLNSTKTTWHGML